MKPIGRVTNADYERWKDVEQFCKQVEEAKESVLGFRVSRERAEFLVETIRGLTRYSEALQANIGNAVTFIESDLRDCANDSFDVRSALTSLVQVLQKEPTS